MPKIHYYAKFIFTNNNFIDSRISDISPKNTTKHKRYKKKHKKTDQEKDIIATSKQYILNNLIALTYITDFILICTYQMMSYLNLILNILEIMLVTFYLWTQLKKRILPPNKEFILIITIITIKHILLLQNPGS